MEEIAVGAAAREPAAVERRAAIAAAAGAVAGLTGLIVEASARRDGVSAAAERVARGVGLLCERRGAAGKRQQRDSKLHAAQATTAAGQPTAAFRRPSSTCGVSAGRLHTLST